MIEPVNPVDKCSPLYLFCHKVGPMNEGDIMPDPIDQTCPFGFGP